MSINLTGKWNYPTTVWSGPGRIRELAAGCRSLGMTRPLLITDEGLAKAPMIAAALAANEADGLPTGLFAGVRGNPTGSNVEQGVAAYKAGNHDGVIAFGGGSALDAAKAVALMVGQSLPLWDFEDVGDNWTRVNVAGVAPIVAIPTTSGTGSEVGRASVITKEDSHEKKLIFHPKMQPALVIADPELTIGLPPHITAATGIDAFIHSFEAYCAPGFHPQADGIALEGMRLVADYLPRAVKDGKDIEARAYMLAAASMGATAFQKGLGGIHAIAHPVGAVYDTHHGLTNAVLWPYVMKHNEAAIAARMPLLARVLDLKDTSFQGVFDWVLAFRKALGIPHTLAEIGVNADRAEEIGAMAHADPSNGTNPVALSTDDLTRIFRNAVNGTMA